MKVKQNEHSVHWLVAGFLSDLTAVCYDHYSKFKHDALYKFYFFLFFRAGSRYSIFRSIN